MVLRFIAVDALQQVLQQIQRNCEYFRNIGKITLNNSPLLLESYRDARSRLGCAFSRMQINLK